MLIGNEINAMFIILCILAVYRVAVLFVYDYGPFHIFWHIRRICSGVTSYENDYWHDCFWAKSECTEADAAMYHGNLAQKFYQTLHEVLDCPFCFGGWAAAVIVLFCPYWLLVILAVWGGQSLVQQMVRTMNGRKG